MEDVFKTDLVNVTCNQRACMEANTIVNEAKKVYQDRINKIIKKKRKDRNNTKSTQLIICCQYILVLK